MLRFARRTRGGRIIPPLCLFAIVAFAQAARAEPFTPQGEDIVLEHLSGVSTRAGSELRALSNAASGDLQHRALAIALARQFIQLGRSTGDPRYFGRAESVLRPLAGPGIQDDPEALVLTATLAQNRHDFATAQSELDRALAIDPTNAQALLTRATVRIVTGHPMEAEPDCAALAGPTSHIVSRICLANVMALTGRAADAQALLEPEIDGAQRSADPALHVWALTSLAEIAEIRGDPAAAEQRYGEALALDPADIYARAALAALLLQQRRPADARAVAGPDLSADVLLLRAALGAKLAGSADATDLAGILKDRFAAAQLRGDFVHRREEAVYQLHINGDARTALDLARANWDVQRERADAAILLEAASASGQADAPASVLEWMHATGIQDRRLAELAARFNPAGASP